jgi:uncharacterized SAM-binding protein YcdF (DUF218 family)
MKNEKKMLSYLSILAVVGLIYVCVLQFKISQHIQTEVPKHADYIIVLGARVKGTVPSLAFASRIKAAASYLKENENTIAIASGGKGPGEDISEAESIRRELIKLGISESRILMENRSTDTYENINYSMKLIPKNAQSGLVVTNTFHIYRAVSIARDQGLEVKGLPAKTPVQALVKSYTREYLAITKFYLKRYLLD